MSQDYGTFRSIFNQFPSQEPVNVKVLLVIFLSIISELINKALFCEGQESRHVELPDILIFLLLTVEGAVFFRLLLPGNVDAHNFPAANIENKKEIELDSDRPNIVNCNRSYFNFCGRILQTFPAKVDNKSLEEIPEVRRFITGTVVFIRAIGCTAVMAAITDLVVLDADPGLGTFEVTVLTEPVTAGLPRE